MDTQKAYNDGYKKGKSWKDDYRPGGPFVGSKPIGINGIKVWEERKAENEAWLKGFDDAIAKRGIILS